MAAARQHSSDLRHLKSVITTLESSDLYACVQEIQIHVNDFGPSARILQLAGEANAQNTLPPDLVVTVDKFKSLLSWYIKHRNFQRQVAGVIIIKAAIEATGLNPFQDVLLLWAKGHLNLLKRTEDKSTRTLCLTGLTRLLQLCQQDEALDRQVVVACMPDLVRSCFKAPQAGATGQVAPAGPVSPTVLHKYTDTVIQTFIVLGPNHIAQLRPFQPMLQAYLRPWVTSHGLDAVQGGIPKPLEICENARQLSIIILACAPRNAIGQAWKTAVDELLRNIHRTLDLIFRSMTEVWTPASIAAANRSAIVGLGLNGAMLRDTEPGPFNLTGWEGIEAGADRVLVLLSFLQVVVNTRTTVQVYIPLDDIYDILDRILMASPHYTNGRTGYDRHERDILSLTVPGFQTAVLRTLYRMVCLFGLEWAPMIPNILYRVSSIWPEVGRSAPVRGVCYLLVAKILCLVGRSMSNREVGALAPIIRACCHDLTNFRAENGRGHQIPDLHSVVDESLKALPSGNITASKLLRVSLKCLRPDQFAGTDAFTRTLLMKTAILTQDEEAMLFAAMSRPDENGSMSASILPLLARAAPQSTGVAALVRPQMPTIMRDAGAEGMTLLNGPPSDSSLNGKQLDALPSRSDEGPKRQFINAFGEPSPPGSAVLPSPTSYMFEPVISPDQSPSEYPFVKKLKQKAAGKQTVRPLNESTLVDVSSTFELPAKNLAGKPFDMAPRKTRAHESDLEGDGSLVYHPALRPSRPQATTAAFKNVTTLEKIQTPVVSQKADSLGGDDSDSDIPKLDMGDTTEEEGDDVDADHEMDEQ